MSQPAGQELVVVTRSLRRTAVIWDEQANAVAALAASITALGLDRLQMGVFQLIASPYQQVVAGASARCGEGRGSMSAIAGALRTAADRYDEAERKNIVAATRVR